jgi:O-antigen/teichoic acid export membrane protein
MNRPDSETRRRLLSRSAYVFGIRALPALAITAVAVVFARRLPEAENGRYQQIWLYIAAFTAIGSAGIPALVITHSLNPVHRWLRRVQTRHVSIFVLLNLGLAVPLTILLRQSGISPWILASMYLGQIASLISETYLVLNDRFRSLLLIIGIYTVGFGAIHIAFLNGSCSFGQLIAGISILIWLRGGIQTAIGVRSYLRQRAVSRPGTMPKPVRRQWLELGMYDMSQLLFRYVDKLLIGWLVGPAGFAIYFMGTMDIPVLPLLLGAAGTAVLRQLATAQTGIEAKVSVMRYSGTVLCRIVFPIFAFLFVFRAEIITTLYGEKYLAAIPLFAISTLAIPLRAYNFTAMLQHLNKVRLINLGALLDLMLALGLSYPLFLQFGLAGVAVAFTLCSYAQAAFYLFHTSRLLRRPVLDLIPGLEWTLLLIVYVCAEGAFRSSFRSMTSERTALFWGAALTVVMIGGSLYFSISRKRHGS